MDSGKKYFFLRIGSNREKEYVKKIGTLFSGLLVKANYFESASGMLSGIFLKFDSLKPSRGYIIDPTTYVFGLKPGFIRSWQKINVDKAEKTLREDLRLGAEENIPSDWKRKIQNPSKLDRKKNKIEIDNIMKAFRKLADLYFSDNIASVIGKRALAKEDFNDRTLTSFVKNVISYQETAITSRYDTSRYSDFKDIIASPLMILSPYFLINNKDDLSFMVKIWNLFDSQYDKGNGAIVLQCTINFLEDNPQLLLDSLSTIRKNNLFLWIDQFDEEIASSTQLEAYVKFVTQAASRGKQVINLYAGGPSPLLFPFGLTGIVNNVGYGLQRGAEPVRGGIPTAHFYIPTLHIREQVLATYELLIKNNLGATKEEFYRDVCSCPICKEGIKNGVKDFVPFYGLIAVPRSKPDSTKKYPTSEALKRCNFHFLFSRLKEYSGAMNATRQQVIDQLTTEINIWRTKKDHLQRLKDILENIPSRI